MKTPKPVITLALTLLSFSLVLADDAVVMPKCGVCAHRGDKQYYPENTVPAFKSAVEKGAQMVEFDVKLTKDGKMVIMHDPTVDRTTNGTGAVADLTFEEIRNLDAGVKFDPKFAGTKVPTLEEALDCIPNNIWINVHCAPNAVVPAAKLIAEKGRLHQAFLATSLKAGLQAREAVPGIQICNMSRYPDVSRYARETIENKCQFIQLTIPCSAEDAKAMHDAGVKINYFYANTPEAFKKQRADGVDFPLTDKLDMMLELFRNEK